MSSKGINMSHPRNREEEVIGDNLFLSVSGMTHVYSFAAHSPGYLLRYSVQTRWFCSGIRWALCRTVGHDRYGFLNWPAWSPTRCRRFLLPRYPRQCLLTGRSHAAPFAGLVHVDSDERRFRLGHGLLPQTQGCEDALKIGLLDNLSVQVRYYTSIIEKRRQQEVCICSTKAR